MATVPRYQQAGVTTQGINAQTNIQTSGEMFSGGAEAVGKNLTTVADIYVRERDSADKAKALQAKKDLSAVANNFLTNSSTGVLNARGENSFNSQERYKNEFSPELEKIKSGLNERQKALFGDYEFDITQNVTKNMEGHLSKQIYIVDEENSKAFLENEQQAAVYNFTDFGEIEKSIDRQKNEVKSMSERNGVSPEVAGSNAMAAESRTRSTVIEQLVNSNNSQSAKLYLDSNKKKMTASDVMRLEKLVKVGSDMQEAQNSADDIVAKYSTDPKAAIKATNKMYSDNVQMRDDVKRRVFGHFDEVDKADKAKREDDNLYGINLAAANRGVPIEDIVPKDMWVKYSDKQKNNLREFAKYGYPNSDNIDTKYRLQLMAGTPATRNSFLQEDLRDYASELTQSSLNGMITLQTEMREGKGKASKTLDGIEAHQSIINNALREAQYDLKSKNIEQITEMNKFRAGVDTEVTTWHANNPNKEIPNSELRRITTTLSADVVTGKAMFFGVNTKPIFMIDPRKDKVAIRFQDIPQSEANIIRDTLIKNRIQPTDQAILDRYIKRVDRIIGN